MTVAFYGGQFGSESHDATLRRSTGSYFIARLHGGDVAGLGSQPDGEPPVALWNTYMQVCWEKFARYFDVEKHGADEREVARDDP